jgi:hypothetical protein
MVQPQPSTSSRSNKVIEQLSSKYESIQRDLAATRAQVSTYEQIKTHTYANVLHNSLKSFVKQS